MNTIYAINVAADISNESWNYLLNNISDNRKYKIAKLRSKKDKKHCMFAELLLRYALMKEFGIYDKHLLIQYNEYGKPGLLNYQTIKYNISHSGEWVVCAVSNFEIGIDVEEIGTLILDVARKVFTEREYNFLINNGDNKLELFYKIWTLKECYVKNIGLGMSLPLSSFEFVNLNKDATIILQNKESTRYGFWSEKLDANHIMSICLDKCDQYKNINKNIKLVTINQMVMFQEK